MQDWIYESDKESIIITGCRIEEKEVTVPGEIEGFPVKTIGKRAFLGRKKMGKLIVPDSVTEIGDWAFTHCKNLEEIWLPGHTMHLGKGIFRDCPKLKKVHMAGKDSKAMEILLAVVPGMTDREYFFAAEEVGTEGWFERWDRKALELIRKDDQEEYFQTVLCGEADCENQENEMECFMKERRKEKVRLSLLRLLYPEGVAVSAEQEYQNFLLRHNKGCEYEETWEVVLQEHGNEREYFELLTRIGCVTESNFEGMLEDLGEKWVEMKAFLMRYKNESMSQTDFFDDLML